MTRLSPAGAPEAPRPWYREPWPWILMGMPASMVVICAITVWVAYRYADPVVTEHAYTKGLHVGAQIDKELDAKQMGLEGQISRVGNTITLQLDPPPPQARITLRLRHPYAPSGDRTLTMRRVAPGRYVGHAATSPVRYTVAVYSATWRLSGIWEPDAASPVTPGV